MAPRLAAALGLVLAAALVLPAVAATPKGGSWSGSTGQGKSISFKVTPGGGKVKNLRFGFRGRCENGATTTGSMSFGGTYPVSGGRFTAKGGMSVVRGTFTTRTKARGTLNWRSRSFDPVSLRQVECRSGRVSWTAKR